MAGCARRPFTGALRPPAARDRRAAVRRADGGLIVREDSWAVGVAVIFPVALSQTDHLRYQPWPGVEDSGPPGTK